MRYLLPLALPALMLATGCASLGAQHRPPTDQSNACAIFDERRGWRDPVFDAARRWDISPGVILAFMRQESSFRRDARPVDRNGNRLSSALGYSQALDGTWADYERARGRGDRRDLRDAADFIGWYLTEISSQTGIDKTNPRDLYLAYHDGPGGFSRGTWRSKEWLIAVAGRVASTANTYDDQLRDCHWWAMRRFKPDG